MNGGHELYKIVETDPSQWLETAEGLRISAKVIWEALVKIRDEPMHLKRERMLAFMQSFMLLSGLAFENVCRGITVAEKKDWRTHLKPRGGHWLVKQLSDITELSPDEKRVAERLETYVVWAGRYPVPKNAQEYASASQKKRRTVGEVDIRIADALFARLADKLKRTAWPAGLP